jgi:hypothetical protein
MGQASRESRLRAVYAQIKALVDDLPEVAFEHDVTAYNNFVDELISLGYDAHSFRLTDADVFRPVASSNSISGEVRYRKSQVHHHVLDRKVKSLLTFLKLTHEETIVEVRLPRTPHER